MRFPTFACVLVLSAAASAHADSVSDTVGPRAIGMGDALQAASFGSVATSLNPAGLVLTHTYEIEGSYGYQPSDSANIIQTSVCDSVTTKVAACLSYKRLTASPSTMDGSWERTMNQGALTMAVPMGDMFSMGSTTRYVSYSETTGTRVSPPDMDKKGLVEDFGANFKPMPTLNFGLVGYNLIGADGKEFARSLGSGVSFTPTPKLMLDADGRWNLQAKTSRYSVGGEYFVATTDGQQGFPIRAGYTYDTDGKGSYVSLGAGFITPRVGIDVGGRKQVGGVGNDLVIQASIRLFLPN